MGDISNRTVVLLLIATIIISLGGAFISLSTVNSRLSGMGLAPITGFALTPNATATVEITTTSSIKFQTAASSVDFGSGGVNTAGGFENCSLSTLYDFTNTGCLTFTEVTQGFTIENDGNTNLSVELMSNQTAVQFIGSSTAAFRWNVTVNDSASCINVSGSDRTAVEPNTTSAGCGGDPAAGASDCGAIFEEVATSYKNICPSLLYDNEHDTLDVNLNITIPEDAPAGVKLAGITVRGTREPLT